MSKKTVRWSRIGALLIGFLASVTGLNIAQAQDRLSMRQSQVLPAGIEALRLDAPAEIQTWPGELGKLNPSLGDASGDTRVTIRLTLPAAGRESGGSQLGRKINIEYQQAAAIGRLREIAPDLRVIAQTQLVLNAVFVEVDAALLPELAKDSAVSRISPVLDYEMDLSETVPYIGAATVQAAGVDGSGVKVAVLDSGIDYNHANLGGSGDPVDYANNDPNIVEPGTFPTAKVVGGFDFVGSTWPNSLEAPDADPLDDGPAAGHGTHVADIIAGTGGVAPGADLYAVKVCSSISSSCSGIALIQGMEFSVDPNGDGNTNDAVDIINMSLGSNYGQPFDDDLSQAVDNATAIGVLTVASSGNSADKPYVTGTPAAAPTALSVAQTQVPSANLQLIDVGGFSAPGVFQPWSVPVSGTIADPLQYGDGAGGNLNGCAPFAPGSLTGLVVLVDRGACNFTLKISNISQAGGAAGIIGLVAPGAPFSGGDGGDRPIDIPGFMVSQADSAQFKALAGSIATIDPSNTLPLIGQMVGSSSRGPSNTFQMVKPEIGAPGASVSANAGTGTGTGAFGGTSGAAPMVSGSAALLLDSYCDDDDDNDSGKRGRHARKQACVDPLVAKAILINNGDPNIDIDPFSGLAEITRIGGGEVRADAAASASAAAYDKHTGQGALSFGFHDVTGTLTLTKHVRVVSTGRLGDGDSDSDSDGRKTWHISTAFRDPADEASGAVTLATNKSRVKTNGSNVQNFTVTMTIDGSALPGNFMNSGSMGANGAALSANEFDGWVILTDNKSGETIHLPWQVLPRKAAEVSAPATFPAGGFPATVPVTNTGVGTAQIDSYSLLVQSPAIPSGGAGQQSPTPDIKSVGINTFGGFGPGSGCSFIWAFAISTHERQSHLIPVSHQIWLDTNQDGTDDFVVLNRDFSFSGASDGRQLTWALNLATGGATAFWFAEHATNTGNTALYICGEQIGLSDADFFKGVNITSIFAQDFYFGGPGDEVVFPNTLTVAPLGEQFFGVPSDIPGNSAGTLAVFDFGPLPGNTPELGLLLFNNGDRGGGARGGATQDTETTNILAQ